MDLTAINDDAAQRCVATLLPPIILQRLDDYAAFLRHVSRLLGMNDEELHRTTQVCLNNLGRPWPKVEDTHGPDARLRHILAPEIWERLRPGSRNALRRISTTLAEYQDPDRRSFWERTRPEVAAHLQETATSLRAEIGRVAALDAATLIEETRQAIAASHVIEKWAPGQCVYEPGFTYRMVPAIAWRLHIHQPTK